MNQALRPCIHSIHFPCQDLRSSEGSDVSAPASSLWCVHTAVFPRAVERLHWPTPVVCNLWACNSGSICRWDEYSGIPPSNKTVLFGQQYAEVSTYPYLLEKGKKKKKGVIKLKRMRWLFFSWCVSGRYPGNQWKN